MLRACVGEKEINPSLALLLHPNLIATIDSHPPTPLFLLSPSHLSENWVCVSCTEKLLASQAGNFFPCGGGVG